MENPPSTDGESDVGPCAAAAGAHPATANFSAAGGAAATGQGAKEPQTSVLLGDAIRTLEKCLCAGIRIDARMRRSLEAGLADLEGAGCAAQVPICRALLRASAMRQ